MAQRSGSYHRQSCIGARFELRITRRCLIDDLGLAEDVAFEVAAARAPIVRAFESQRLGNPIGSDTVGPAAGDLTLYTLRHTHDHRGATWHDSQEGVVWLCAYRLHRSGEPDDAFPYFRSLISADQMMPDEGDYEALFADRARRFVDTLSVDAQTLLAAARATPGREHRGVIGGELDAGLVVEVVETLEETWVALAPRRLDAERILLVLRALFPDVDFTAWELVTELPHRALERGEIGYRLLRDAHSDRT